MSGHPLEDERVKTKAEMAVFVGLALKALETDMKRKLHESGEPSTAIGRVAEDFVAKMLERVAARAEQVMSHVDSPKSGIP